MSTPSNPAPGGAPSGPWRQPALVVNSRSRSGRHAYDDALATLTRLGVEPAVAHPVQDPVRLPEVVREVLQEGCDLLVLGGGDGTMSACVDLLAERDVVLGLLPLGTANDFARTLEVPPELERACATVARGRVVDIDLGLVGEDWFVNVASIGLSVAVTRALSPQLKRRAGALAYPVAAARSLLAHEAFTARLEFPDGDHPPLELDSLLQVAVGNGRFYGGGNVIAPGAGIDDHQLDVYAIRTGHRRRDLLGVARDFRSGRFTSREEVVHLTTRRVRLSADPVQEVNIDGEVVARTPQEVRVVRNALHVLVPDGSRAARDDREAAPDEGGRG